MIDRVSFHMSDSSGGCGLHIFRRVACLATGFGPVDQFYVQLGDRWSFSWGPGSSSSDHGPFLGSEVLSKWFWRHYSHCFCVFAHTFERNTTKNKNVSYA